MYNGCTGTVSEFDEESSRFVVALDKKPKGPKAKSSLRVKRANLKLGAMKKGFWDSAAKEGKATGLSEGREEENIEYVRPKMNQKQAFEESLKLPEVQSSMEAAPEYAKEDLMAKIFADAEFSAQFQQPKMQEAIAEMQKDSNAFKEK